MRRALFLDRDGTVIEDHGYMRDPDLVNLLPGAAEELRSLFRDGWVLIVVSNQSGVGRGLISPEAQEAVQARFLDALREAGVVIEGSYFCPHRPDENCMCRKPSPLLLERASREHGIDLRRSWMIGDRRADILAGRTAGCRTIWMRNTVHPSAEGLADYLAMDWAEAAAVIRERDQIEAAEGLKS